MNKKNTFLASLLLYSLTLHAQYKSFEKGNKCGYKNGDGKVVIQAQFNSCGYFYKTSTYVLRAVVGINATNDACRDCKKYGIINSNGENITGFKYEFINDNLRDNQFVVASVDGKYAIVNTETGKEFLGSGTFTDVWGFEYLPDGKLNRYRSGVIDYYGLVLYKNIEGKWGIIDVDGKAVLPNEYDKIVKKECKDRYANRIACNYLLLYKNGKIGICFGKNRIIPALYDSIGEYDAEYNKSFYSFMEKLIQSRKINYQDPCFGNFIIGKQAGRYALYDKDCNELVPCCEDVIPPHPFGASVRIHNGKVGLIDPSGQLIIPIEYDDVSDLTNYWKQGGCKGYTTIKNGLYGMLDPNGKELLPNKYKTYVIQLATGNIKDKIGFVHPDGSTVDVLTPGCVLSKSTLDKFYDTNTALEVSKTMNSTPKVICNTCMYCEGTGQSNEKVAVYGRCYICDGTGYSGYVSDNPQTGRDHARWYGGPGYKRAVCTKCKGTGKTYEKSVNQNCKICNGTGCSSD